MKEFLRSLLLRPVLFLVDRFSSAPDRTRVFESLTALMQTIISKPGKKGFVIPFNSQSQRFIIFSDQHKGRKNGADDFLVCEQIYVDALRHYDREGFHLIALGDCEELWENTILQIVNSNEMSFEAERNFVRRDAFTKIFGNHDLDWDIDPLAPTYLKRLYERQIETLEGIVLETTLGEKILRIFCTHGHQGDLQSDGNWFSKFFITKIWAPFQAFLRINPNTPAFDQRLKTKHNHMMYEWSGSQKDLLLITGHTHQPVFESMTAFERQQWQHRQMLHQHNPHWAKAIEDELTWRHKDEPIPTELFSDVKPSYFNAGCCCYSDGVITGIEIAGGFIRLIKWEKIEGGASTRSTIHERKLEEILSKLSH